MPLPSSDHSEHYDHGQSSRGYCVRDISRQLCHPGGWRWPVFAGWFWAWFSTPFQSRLWVRLISGDQSSRGPRSPISLWHLRYPRCLLSTPRRRIIFQFRSYFLRPHLFDFRYRLSKPGQHLVLYRLLKFWPHLSRPRHYLSKLRRFLPNIRLVGEWWFSPRSWTFRTSLQWGRGPMLSRCTIFGRLIGRKLSLLYAWRIYFIIWISLSFTVFFFSSVLQYLSAWNKPSSLEPSSVEKVQIILTQCLTFREHRQQPMHGKARGWLLRKLHRTSPLARVRKADRHFANAGITGSP